MIHRHLEGETQEVEKKINRNIRYAEKRRTATCAFADRVAHVSIDHYRNTVPERERPQQTCLATIVAHDGKDNLWVVGMGVGTKFLSESILRDEERSLKYGKRIRDSHAEVLARRAFRRQLTLEVLRAMHCTEDKFDENDGILECYATANSKRKFRLRSGITLHLYTSSAPCGNATLKKFSKMTKETLRDDLRPDEWPQEPHVPIHGSSIQLGQFSLLVKKDSESAATDNPDSADIVDFTQPIIQPKGKLWPAMISDDWVPPGTTIVAMTHKGSIHTCSDKICRWNCLGLQGSLLSSLLEQPLYLSTITVGRKFTSCICRRAVCCRMEQQWKDKQKPRKVKNDQEPPDRISWSNIRVNHPAVLGTAVYMDETGVVETSSDIRGQDVRFHSTKAWCWWPLLEQEVGMPSIERIDGSSGYLWKEIESEILADTPSLVSTASLIELFLKAYHLVGGCADLPSMSSSTIQTLTDIRVLKRQICTDYETAKDKLLSEHRIFRQWRRRASPQI